MAGLIEAISNPPPRHLKLFEIMKLIREDKESGYVRSAKPAPPAATQAAPNAGKYHS